MSGLINYIYKRLLVILGNKKLTCSELDNGGVNADKSLILELVSLANCWV